MKKIISILISLTISVILYGTNENKAKLVELKKEVQKEIVDMETLLEEKEKKVNQNVEETNIENLEFYEVGGASFYGGKFHGRKTASGQIFNKHKMTAAHKKIPFGTKVKVTNLSNGKSVVVKINDRGPFIKGRVIDLSRGAFEAIEKLGKGVTKVKLEILK